MWYVLDAENFLTEVSPEWDQFALDNGGEAVCASKVLGRDLFDFIDGDETCGLMAALLHYCREANTELFSYYRCDGDGFARVFEMLIIPRPGKGLAVAHRLHWHGEVPWCAAPADLPTELPEVVRCSQCLDVAVEDVWHEVVGVVAKKTAYTVCPTCREVAARRVQAVPL